MRRLLTMWTMLFWQTAALCFAQAPLIDSEYLKAQEFEQQGNYSEAREIYRRLYESKKNDQYFWRLMLANERLNDFMSMEKLALTRLDSHPDELPTMRYLTRAYYGLGDTKKAREVALAIIGNNWNDFSRIVYSAGELTNNNDFDTALQIYMKAREKSRDSGLFSVEIGRLYLLKFQYVKAIEEYLKSLESVEISYANIEQIIDDALDAGEKPETFVQPLENYLRQNPKSVKTARLLSGLKYRMGDFRGALAVLVDPAVAPGSAQEIWDIAGRFRTDGHPGEALAAYEAFGRLFTGNPNRIKALSNSASIKADMGDSEGARRDYLRITQDYGGTEDAAYATLRLLELSKDTMGSEGFIKALREFASATKVRKAALEASMLLADTFMRDGNPGEAHNVLSEFRVKSRSKEELYDIASRSALYYFFTADFESMGREVDACVSYASAENDMNDLLDLKVLNMRCSTESDRKGFTALAHGRYALYRGLYEEAADSLTYAAQDSSAAAASSAALTLAGMNRDRGNSDQAYTWYLYAASAAHDTTERVEAMIDAADLLLTERRDSEGARALYLKAMTSCPGTVYDSILRRKLRMVVE
ncbi:hypothetical protein LLG96_16085 [bacterium]|nr:hypothetical protein [bacterium]